MKKQLSFSNCISKVLHSINLLFLKFSHVNVIKHGSWISFAGAKSRSVTWMQRWALTVRRSSMRLSSGAGRLLGRGGGGTSPVFCTRPAAPAFCPAATPFSLCPGLDGPGESSRPKSRSPISSCSTSFSVAPPSSVIITTGSEVRSAMVRSLPGATAAAVGVLFGGARTSLTTVAGFFLRISSFSRLKRRIIAARHRESFISFFLFFFSGRFRAETLTETEKQKSCHIHSHSKVQGQKENSSRDSKDIYNVTKDFCSFELSTHQFILKNKMNHGFNKNMKQ